VDAPGQRDIERRRTEVLQKQPPEMTAGEAKPVGQPLDRTIVQRAIALIQTMFVSSMQEAGERADKLSMFATYFGKPELINEEVDRYRAVTTEQVNAFIRERLGENNRASLLYVPREEAADEASDVAVLSGTA